MRKKWITTALTISVCGLLLYPLQASAQNDALAALIQKYEAYEQSFAAIETVEDIEANGYEIIADHCFPMDWEIPAESEEDSTSAGSGEPGTSSGESGRGGSASAGSGWMGISSAEAAEGQVIFIPILHREYCRLAVLITDIEGNVLYKTNQLETNYKYPGQLEQPTKDIAAVSFQDLNHDNFTDIILITNCENTTGSYAGETYKVGDVLFQREKSFYRDWRISDKINRFSMNKSADFIAAYVRDGNSTEILYTAATLDELLDNGFRIVEEHCYWYSFEKQGRLQVVPGIIRMAEYDVFMIYLVNEQGYIVWSFQPMENYDNLYALRGMSCKDLDGDGMKDIVLLARYSYSGPAGELLIDNKCSIYYQRTDGFAIDLEFGDFYQCTEEDTVGGLVELIREYWGWPKEE